MDHHDPSPTGRSFTISRAQPGDARQLAEVAARAFAHDAHTRVKAAVRPPGHFADGMASGFAAWLAVPDRCVVLKAVDDDGRIVGVVCWAFRGVEVENPPFQPEAAAATDPVAAAAATNPHEDPPSAPSTDADAIARIDALEAMTSAHLAAFRESVMPAGTACLYVMAIAVDPAAQGRGVGARLLRWGTARADRAGVFCWVHASEAGAAVFARRGFREVDRLVVDLDRWAAGPPPPSEEKGDGEREKEGNEEKGARGRWGEYTFRYMVRQPEKCEEGVGRDL